MISLEPLNPARPGKYANIAIFVPHLGCPQRCSFCEQNAITGANHAPPPTPEDVLSAAEIAARSLGERRKEAEIAFFGGSFTAIRRDYMLALLSAAKEAADRYGFHGIRCSTRPDAVDSETLELLSAYGVTAIELGAQSMDDGVLQANRRGHTARDTAEAADLIRAGGFELGLQMMTGLYKSTAEGDLETARRLIALKPATMRIYPTLVLPGTELARLYDRGEYCPQSLEQAVELCAVLLEEFRRAGVRVIRLGLHASPELEKKRLAGPYHPAFRQLVESRVYLEQLLRVLEQSGPGEYVVEVDPRELSIALGQRKANLEELARRGYRVTFRQRLEDQL